MNIEDDKVINIFKNLIGDKANNLRGDFYPAFANSAITEALKEEYPNLTEEKIIETDSIGMNLVCWQRNAAFIVALCLFPEKFTKEEIQDEVQSLLIHMPDHIKDALVSYDKLAEKQ